MLDVQQKQQREVRSGYGKNDFRN